MKKIIYFIIAFCFLFSLLSCNMPHIEYNSSSSEKAQINKTDNARPIKFFNDLNEFQSWIERPDLEIDKLGEQNGRDYENSIYSDTHKMFAVDRFYLIPVVPAGYQLVDNGCHISLGDVTFVFEDTAGNRCGFSYRTDGKIEINNQVISTQKNSMSYFGNRVLKTDSYHNKNYYLMDTPQDHIQICQYFDDYLCLINISTAENSELSFIPEKVDSSTDITPIIDNIHFIRVNLPPIQE